MLDSYKPGVSRLSQRGASAPSLTSQFHQHRYTAAFSAAPQFYTLCLCSIIGSGQTPAASRTKNPSIFYLCHHRGFLIFCCLDQKSCPPVFPVLPVLRRKFQMAEKYNLPRSRRDPPLFPPPPGVGGGCQGPALIRSPPAAPPPSSMATQAATRRTIAICMSASQGHQALILRTVIENPDNHPISKQSVISLVRIICIERTSARYHPLRL